jgi:heat shock protein HslJ
VTDATAMATLDETTWRAIRFGPAPGLEPPPEAEFSLQFEGDRLAGRSGCNRYMGTWQLVDGHLQIGQLASTMMWCDGLMEAERAFLEALQASVDVATGDGRLAFVDAEGSPLLELVPA